MLYPTTNGSNNGESGVATDPTSRMLVGGRLAIINVAPTHRASLNLKMGFNQAHHKWAFYKRPFSRVFCDLHFGGSSWVTTGRSCFGVCLSWICDSPRCSEKVPKNMDFQMVVKDGDESHGIIRKK